MRWKFLPLPERKDRKDYWDAVRLNSLGSLYFFIWFTLGRNRLVNLHWDLCRSLEKEALHEVLEVPRGHFKTTIVLGMSVWWALPFTDADEAKMRMWGYDDEWIRWMRVAHNQDTRTFTISETSDNVTLMGKDIDAYYQTNATFRETFPEIIPDSFSYEWGANAKYQKRRNKKKEGTFNFRAIGQAIQSLHGDRIIEDDVFGRDAQRSLLLGDGRVVEDAIRYHRQLTGVYDPESSLRPRVVVGNRWAHADLNGWIRLNEPKYRIETHSAEGGCCALHPKNAPIFPEEYTMDSLQEIRRELGPYDYSHFYLNVAMLPEEIVFKEEWLRYYKFKQSMPDLGPDDERNYLMLEHEVVAGQTLEDIPVGSMHLRLIIDPNHAGKRGRSRHAIVVIGLDSEHDRMYLLDEWAEAASYSDLIGKIYGLATKWGLREAWLETVAAQQYLKFYLDEKNRTETRPIIFRELPKDTRANAKDIRIDALEPMLRNGQFFCHRSHSEFLREYRNYAPGEQSGCTKDVLDVVAYAPQTYEVVRRREVFQAMRTRESEFRQRSVGPGGY